ncbi:hypothetical protein HK104_002736 [Borealophlyctis nickersoniae]|nr:hypothetical protein HK104_002736 [Borealophlyctis nickersoniae]
MSIVAMGSALADIILHLEYTGFHRSDLVRVVFVGGAAMVTFCLGIIGFTDEVLDSNGKMSLPYRHLRRWLTTLLLISIGIFGGGLSPLALIGIICVDYYVFMWNR